MDSDRHGIIRDMLRLALYLQRTSQGLTIEEIQDFLGGTRKCSRKTAERRLGLLKELFDLESVAGPSNRRYWRLPPAGRTGLDGIRRDHLVSLTNALDLLQRQGRTSDHATLSHLAALLQARLAGTLLRRVEPEAEVLAEALGIALRPGPREIPDPAVTEAIERALVTGSRLRLRHRARGQDDARGLAAPAPAGTVAEVVDPLGLLHGHGQRLLIACSATGQQMRMLPLADIQAATATGAPAEPPSGIDLPAVVAASFGVTLEAPVDVHVRFHPSLVDRLRSWRFHPSQRLVLASDGWLDVHWHAGGLREMAWHLLSWGNRVRVVAPEALRQTLAQVLADGARALDPA